LEKVKICGKVKIGGINMQDSKNIVDKSGFLAFKNFISLEKAFSGKTELEKIKFIISLELFC